MPAGCLPWGSRREAELTDVPFSFSRSKRRRRARRWPLALAVLAVLVIGGLAAALFVRTVQYRHETVPGVSVLGQGVGGRSRAPLERRIEQIVGARLAQPVTLLVGRKTVSVRPDRVLAVDAKATADAALRAGQASFLSRSASLLLPFSRRRSVAPVLRIRRIAAGAFLSELRKLGTTARDATVALHGLRPVVTPARAGSVPLGNELLGGLQAQVPAGGRTVRVRFRSEARRIETIAAKGAATEVVTFLSAAVSLSFDGQDVGSLSPDALSRLLRFRPHGTGYSVVFSPKSLVEA